MASTYWLIVSDLHCGSVVGLVPPDFECEEEQRVRHSPITGWIWDQWQALLPWVQQHTGDAGYGLLCNGDTIEGLHHRTTQVWSPDAADHHNAAKQCLEPLADGANRVVFTLGTECHTGNSERALAKHFGGEVYDVFRHTERGVNMMALHHMPATSREWLKSNALGMELANHQLCEARQGRPITEVLIMSHRHVFGCFTDGMGMAIATPAWQALTRHGNKVVRGQNVSVGAVLLEFHADRELPTVHNYLKPLGVMK